MRHELLLTGKGLRALAVAVLPICGLGALLGGRNGALSALAGAAVIAANQAAAAASTGWSRTLSPGTVSAGYAFFVVRMFGVFAALVVLAQMPWIHKAAFASAFCASLVLTLTVECLSYVRKSYVPAWRMTE